MRSTPIGLDGTNDEVFWSILRLGQRMLHHELRGHRPHRNVTQFRLEIGKYVDGGEVDRFEYCVQVD